MAYQSSSYEGYGILPRDVVFAAMQADLLDRHNAGGFSLGPAMLEAQAPITRISGFNSRMENLDSVPGAREAENFVADLTHAAMVSFVTDGAASKTDLLVILARWASYAAELMVPVVPRGRTVCDAMPIARRGAAPTQNARGEGHGRLL